MTPVNPMNEKIYRDAQNFVSALGPIDPKDNLALVVACRAIKWERDRCARVVEKGLGQTNTTIARAIRNGDAP